MRVLEYLSDERVIHTKSAAATLIHITLPPRITHKIITKAYLAERTPWPTTPAAAFSFVAMLTFVMAHTAAQDSYPRS